MIKSTKTWIIIFSVLALTSLGCWIWMQSVHIDHKIAKIYHNGECIKTIDLNAVSEPYEFTVETEHGKNTVRVEFGRIRIVDASCPDHICVNQGWISDGTAPIVCLPNKLVIKIEKQENELDAKTQ
ncbi:MAG: NusG domain II-containing protein [Clostridia bacterium]|nr:NusG domain II-containing protein [Clostridia bacterium]